MDHRRRAKGRTRGPLAMSLLLHAAVLGLLAATGSSAPQPAKTKVYAVDIVSPPPNLAGEPPAAPLATQEPGPAAAQPDPLAAEPAAQPEPPAPDPEPAPPRETPKEAPKEPAKAPEPRRTPEQPAQRPPATPTPRTNPADRPKNTERPKNAEERPKQNPTSANRPASGSTQSGTGSGPNRTQGGGTQTGAATGRNPDAASPGGEGLNIHVEGDPCPVAGYCENVTRQVNRFFRPPPGTAGATGEVCFRIQRNGSVTDIQTRGVRGAAAFRLAMMEAAEAAGSRRAFGTLPAAFDPGRWRWCVELSPS
jgi:outer membrane biosynthesis protein TonB